MCLCSAEAAPFQTHVFTQFIFLVAAVFKLKSVYVQRLLRLNKHMRSISFYCQRFLCLSTDMFLFPAVSVSKEKTVLLSSYCI